MGKKDKAKSEKVDVAAKSASQPSFLSGDAPIDPSLASLFEKSVCFCSAYTSREESADID